MNISDIRYKPEGMNKVDSQSSLSEIEEVMKAGKIIEVRAIKCDEDLNLIIQLGKGLLGVIPYGESEIGKNGEIKKISVISKVGKTLKVKVTKIEDDGKNIILSRKEAQQEFLELLKTEDSIGEIVKAKVINAERFGAFIDIGCGLTAMLPSDNISVSRVSDARKAFAPGDIINVIISEIDGTKITVSHKELLGTWQENVDHFGFKTGETVVGKVRTITPYGVFIELSSNLSGLSEVRQGIKEGDSVTVYIKNIIPEKMKVKLSIIDKVDYAEEHSGFKYFITNGHLNEWSYAPGISEKGLTTVFK